MNKLHRAVALAGAYKRVLNSVSLIQAYSAVPTLRCHSPVLCLVKSFLEVSTVGATNLNFELKKFLQLVKP